MEQALHRDRGNDLLEGLDRYEKENGSLPGLSDPEYRRTLVAQMVSSLRRIEYISVVRQRSMSSQRSDPQSPLFDPLRAALADAHRGKLDEAVWTTFVATHFGKHISDGWKLAANVYGSFGHGPTWTAAEYTKDPAGFENMLQQRSAELRNSKQSGRFSNHRRYQSKDPSNIARTFSTYHQWQFRNGGFDAKIRDIHRRHGQRPEEVFDVLFHSMNYVHGFGRLGNFDFLTMLGKMQLAPIVPGSVYLVGATGPLRGAQLLFLGDAEKNGQPRALEQSVDRLDDYLNVGKQVLEDSLCNWQKSPRKYVYFAG